MGVGFDSTERSGNPRVGGGSLVVEILLSSAIKAGARNLGVRPVNNASAVGDLGGIQIGPWTEEVICRLEEIGLARRAHQLELDSRIGSLNHQIADGLTNGTADTDSHVPLGRLANVMRDWEEWKDVG